MIAVSEFLLYPKVSSSAFVAFSRLSSVVYFAPLKKQEGLLPIVIL